MKMVLDTFLLQSTNLGKRAASSTVSGRNTETGYKGSPVLKEKSGLRQVKQTEEGFCQAGGVGDLASSRQGVFRAQRKDLGGKV